MGLSDILDILVSQWKIYDFKISMSLSNLGAGKRSINICKARKKFGQSDLLSTGNMCYLVRGRRIIYEYSKS